MNSIQERMKKYAELHAELKNPEHCGGWQYTYTNMHSDLQTAMQCIEMMRGEFSAILHYDPTPTFQGGVAYRAIETIDELLGKAGV
jgi:hypothetical protein